MGESTRIKHSVGASGLAGSLGGESEAILSQGFADADIPKVSPWDFNPSVPPADDSGNTSVGNKWEFRQTGAAGRPNGNER